MKRGTILVGLCISVMAVPIIARLVSGQERIFNIHEALARISHQPF